MLAEGFMRFSSEGWRRFFKVETLQLAGRASRLLKLANLLRSATASPSTVKIVMGVIGKNTVGHSREIQKCFSRFLGVDCLGCREAVEKISMGIPFPRVRNSVRVVPKESDWLSALETLDRLLVESLKSVGYEISGDYVESLVKRDYTALTGNPLKVFGLLKGFFAASRRILPFYSPYAFFINSLRYVPRFAIERLVGEESLEVARTFNIVAEELLPSENREYSLLTHGPGTAGSLLSSAIELVYRVHELGMPHSSRYLRIRDEKGLYLDSAGQTMDFLAKLLGVEREVSTLNRTLLVLGSAVREHRGYRLVRLVLRAERPSTHVLLGNKRLDVEIFMKGLSPYFILGLGWLENIASNETHIAADLLVYLRMR